MKYQRIKAFCSRLRKRLRLMMIDVHVYLNKVMDGFTIYRCDECGGIGITWEEFKFHMKDAHALVHTAAKHKQEITADKVYDEKSNTYEYRRIEDGKYLCNRPY